MRSCDAVRRRHQLKLAEEEALNKGMEGTAAEVAEMYKKTSEDIFLL